MIVLALGVLMLAALWLAPARLAALHNRAALAAGGVLALIVTVIGWRLAPEIAVYAPPAWGWYAAFGLSLMAFLCIAVFLFRGKLRARLPAPLALAVLFLALGHLLANGDAAGLILFGGLGAAALIRLVVSRPPNAAPPPVIRDGHDALSLMAGVAMFAVMAQLHALYAGVPAFVIPALGP